MEAVQFGQFFGGLSRSDIHGKQGSFIYSENLDNISNLQYIQVSRKPKNIWNGKEKITHIIECYSQYYSKSPVLIFGQKGTVWNINQNDPIYKFQKDATNYDAYLREKKQIFKYVHYMGGDLVYIAPKPYKDGESYTLSISDDVLYKNYIDCSRRSSEQPGDGTYYYGDGSGQIADRIQRGNYGSFLVGVYMYVYARFEIFRVSLLTGEIKRFTITSSDIAGMTYSGGLFKVYEHSGNMYLWDGVANNPHQFYDLEDSIEKIGNMKGIDYYTSKTGIGFVESVQAKNIFKKNKSFYLDHEKFKTKLPRLNNIVSSNGLLYLMEKIENNKGHRFIVFGNLASEAPISYTVWHVASNYKEVNVMSKSVDGIYVSYEDYDGNFGVDFYDFYDLESMEKQESGYVILREFYKPPLPKVWKSSSLSVFVYDINTEKDYIKIEYMADRGEWQELETINHNTPLDRDNRGRGSRIITTMNKKFNVITFKISIFGDAKLYSKDLVYE